MSGKNNQRTIDISSTSTQAQDNHGIGMIRSIESETSIPLPIEQTEYLKQKQEEAKQKQEEARERIEQLALQREESRERMEKLALEREESREKLAMILGFVLAATVLCSYLFIGGILWRYGGEDDSAAVLTTSKDVITLLVTSQAGLLGAALGFYFGGRSEVVRRDKKQDQSSN